MKEVKVCPKCKKEKPLSEFHKNNTRKDGLARCCKSCVHEYDVEYYAKHREKIARRKQEYYRENREHLLAVKAVYYKEHREEIRLLSRKYRVGRQVERAEYDRKNKEKFRDRELRRKFGITLAAYNAILDFQDGACALCGKVPREGARNLDVDHDHETGEVRGLLCSQCNRGIGFLNDSSEICIRAASYLQSEQQD